MKKLFALLAVVLAVVSCQKDVDNLDVNMGGDVATISVALPADAITRAAADKTNSAWSGLQNEKEEEITVTLYIFDENGVPSVKPYTQTLVEDDLVANFEVRLVPGRDYRFVAWAGQVGAKDNFTLNTPIEEVWNIVLNNEWTAMDESRDAFTGYLVVEDFNSAKTIPTLELTRPFAKLRVITTDMEWITNNNVNPTYAEVSYEVALPSSINAYSQAINYNEPFAKKLHNTFAIKDYTEDADGEMTLFTDYILVPKAGVVKFNLNVYEDDSKNRKLITSTTFTTDIPVERNHLTTIKGNILTDGNNINVEVKPGFDEPEVEVDGDIKDELTEAAKNKHYVIDLEGDFIWETGAGHGSNPLIPADAITETLIINGNCHKFIATGTGVGAIRLANGGKLILNNLTVVDQSEYHAENGEVAWEFTYLEFAGETEFNNCVIDNTISLDGTKAVFNNCTFNDKETWPANVGQEYAAWVSNGEVKFNGCKFSGSRGIKVHEAYGSEVSEVVVDKCTFTNITEKPGMALGTLNADTKVEIKNSTFTNCQPGDQGLYMYETDTDVTKFDFSQTNNTVNATVATSEVFAKVLKADIHTLNIALEGDVNVDVAANSTDYYFGGNNTNTITIDGAKVTTTAATGAGDNTYALTFNHKNSDWNYIRLNNDNAKWVIKNVKLSNSGKNDGPWNRHDISFFNDVVLENVTSDKAIALFGDSDLTNVIISDVHPDNGEAYALWIRPFGQTVNINNCALLAHESKTTDRGIKIDNQHVNEGEAKVTLNVDGLKVKSQKKAAIVVKSKAGADINIKNINLSEVAADTNNAVWVDSNAKQYAGLVSVTGASMVVEGVDPIEGDTADARQAALNAAVTTENAIVQLPAGEYTFPKNFAKGVTVICEEGTVFNGKSSLDINGATVIGATFSNPNGTAVDQTINGTFKNCTFTGSNALRYCYAGETVVFEDCVFSGNVYGIHFDGGANDVIFRNCKISGFNALGAELTMVTFEGCTFVGNDKSAYNGANLFGSAKLINCEFTFDGKTKTEWIDCKGGSDKTYEFVNCTVNGVKYTAENYQSYKIYSSSDKTVKINGVDCQF